MATQVYRYRNCLSQALRGVIVPSEAITCGSVNCSDENHIRAINVYADHVTEACIAAGVGPPFPRSAIPKAVIQGLRGIVLDIVSYCV